MGIYMNPFRLVKTYGKKVIDLPKNAEPLNFLMIRTTREAKHYAKKNIKYKIINTKNIILLHPLERKHAIRKFLKRRKYIRQNKKHIQTQIKTKGYLDLETIRKKSHRSITKPLVHTIKPKGNTTKYITGSGVGRIAAIQSIYPK